MDIDNAVKILKSGIEHNEATKTIIERLSPKTVLFEGDGYADGQIVYDMAFCPNCNRYFEDGSETWEAEYCPECGQRLNWEAEPEE